MGNSTETEEELEVRLDRERRLRTDRRIARQAALGARCRICGELLPGRDEGDDYCTAHSNITDPVIFFRYNAALRLKKGS
jgi:hypothetical protein